MTTQVQVRDAVMTVDGVRLHYREWGDQAAPPLILVHGLSGHARSWDTFASAMTDRFRVLALDVRGHGESDHPGDYQLDRLVAELGGFVDALGLDRCALLGLSMGGTMAFVYAARHPERVERLVTVDVGPDVGRAPGLEQWLAFFKAAPDLSYAEPEEAVRLTRERNPRPPAEHLRRLVLANLVQRADGRWAYRFDAAHFPTYLESVLTAEAEAALWALLPRVTCPTLLVHGTESDVLLAGTVERMRSAITRCQVVEVAQAGHLVPIDNPDGFLAAVRPFLLPPA